MTCLKDKYFIETQVLEDYKIRNFENRSFKDIFFKKKTKLDYLIIFKNYSI